MKKLLFLLLAYFAIAAPAISQKYVERNADGRLYKTYTTTDSFYHNIDTLPVTANEAGILEVKIVAIASDGTLAATGLLRYRYKVVAGTLTLGSVVNSQTPVVDSGLSPTTFDVSTTANKLYVRVKGHLTKTVYWYSVTKRSTVQVSP